MMRKDGEGKGHIGPKAGKGARDRQEAKGGHGEWGGAGDTTTKILFENVIMISNSLRNNQK